jgi:C4-dicarboxylate transporter
MLKEISSTTVVVDQAIQYPMCVLFSMATHVFLQALLALLAGSGTAACFCFALLVR